MRRASLLVAVAAVSLVIVSACTSFPDLKLEDGLTGEDGSTGAGGDDDGSAAGGDDSGGGGTSDGTAPGADTGTSGKDASGTDATAAKDSAPPADAAKADTGPTACTTFPLDCSVPANKMCTACKDACMATPPQMTVCAMSTPNCCVLSEDGQSANYDVCCYSPTGSLFPVVVLAGSCGSASNDNCTTLGAGH